MSAIRRVIKRLVPESVLPLVQYVLAKYEKYTLLDCEIQIDSFYHLFSSSDRVCLRSGETVRLSDRPQVPYFPQAASLDQPIYEVPDVVVAELDNALYSRTGVTLTQDRTVVAESISSRRSKDWLDIPRLIVPKVRALTGVCLPLRSMHNNYYHTLIDNLSRISYLRHPHFRHYENIQLLTAGPLSPTEEFFLPHILPSNAEICILDRAGRVDPLYHPEKTLFLTFPTRPFSGYVPSAYISMMRQTFGPKRPSRRCNRIYISRADARWRRVTNEAAVIDMLAGDGFEVYELETLSQSEQIELFYDAEIVVSPHGAGLANLLFSPEAAVVELFPTPYFEPYYYLLCQSLGLQHWVMMGDAATWKDDFTVDVAALRPLVQQAIRTMRST